MEAALISNPIRKVLSIFQSCGVRALLMGGQACVFYGAAEFSRDTDFAIHPDPDNLSRLQSALEALKASVIAVPPFSERYLNKGHAVHFRCGHPEALGMRVDVMSKMRGVSDFALLWERRTTLQGPDGAIYELMALADLVQAKKTQRDKDWPMIRRLIEADWAAHRAKPSRQQIKFWLREARTPALIRSLIRDFPIEAAGIMAQARPLLTVAANADDDAIEMELNLEERRERTLDRAYWGPLKSELEKMRHGVFDF